MADEEEEKEDAAEATEGEDGGEDDDEEEGGKSLGGKKKLIIIVAVVLLLAGIGAGVFFSGILGGDEPASEEVAAEEGPEGEATAAAEESDVPVYYEMPEFLVNLNTGGSKVSFLKMSITLEVSNQEGIATIEANLPRIQDSFNTYLREVRASDLSGSAGMYRLREELLARVNKAVSPAKVNNILFKDFLVQ